MRNIQVGITDHLDPEVNAMLMAMYSRSYVPIATRIPNTDESTLEHKEKLGKFYIGYNHKSVGQLGGTTVWLEGISQLAAKAVENHPLFNGQESSTRYINFADQPMVAPNVEIWQWQEKFRAFYIKTLPLVVEKIKLEFPFEDNQGNYHHKEDAAVQEARKRTTWENTVKARAFDICRGLLPAGCTTNVAFSGTFDTINDHFGEMLKHPCEEMRVIAEETITGLTNKYSYAAFTVEQALDRNKFVTDEFFYQTAFSDIPVNPSLKVEPVPSLPQNFMTQIRGELKDRKKFDKFPKYYSDKIRITMSGELDFGSYRDLHRHRNGCLNMEVLGVSRGFHSFYSNNLPKESQAELRDLLTEYEEWFLINDDISAVNKQYSTPMGYKVAINYTCDLNQALYIMELRSGKTVHQTLRKLVHQWVRTLAIVIGPEQVQQGVHADMDEDNFTLRRGQQTFSEAVDKVLYK